MAGLSYSPLPTPSSIRLLEVKPGAPSDIIDCSLIIVNLSDAPEYQALSYTWDLDPPIFPYELSYLSHKMPKISNAVTNGMDTINYTINNLMVSPQAWIPWINKPSEDLNPETDAETKVGSERDKILCDGQGVYIKPNFYQALVQIRKKRPGLYWIDAICINQSDTAERGQQVQMMDQIYSSAVQVTIWLGTCPHIFAPGVENLVSVAKTGFPAEPKDMMVKDFIYSRIGTTSVWHLVLCVVYLVTRKWFNRLWVLQELCLAKQAIFFLGEYQFEADDISAAFAWIRHTLKAWNTDGWYMFSQLMTSLGDVPEQAISLLNSRRTIAQGHKMSLQEWLRIVKDREAGDPRDMIFGGLALIDPDTTRINPGLKTGHPVSLPMVVTNKEGTPTSELYPETQGISPNRLLSTEASWKTLQADYEITLPMLLEGVAMCLLSGPDAMDLLSLATRYRNPYFYNMRRESVLNFSLIKLDRQSGIEATAPSWCAMPWMENSRLMRPLIWQGGTSCEFTSKMTNEPSITSDGKTLCLDAMYLDIIEDCVLVNLFGDLAHDAESIIILRSKSVEDAELRAKMTQNFNYLPPFQLLDVAIGMQSEYERPLETLCDILLAGAWESGGSENGKMVAFCQWLDEWVQSFVKNHEKNKSEAAKDIPTFQEFLERREGVIAKLQDDYSKLKATYPDQPWSDDHPKNISEERKVLAVRFSRTLQKAQALRCLFRTKKGVFVLGPAWAEKGDVVMGVKGGKVPHVFTPRDEDLRRKIAFKENYKSGLSLGVLQERVGHIEANKLDVDYLRGEIGKRDCYVLTGEAYIYGSSLAKLVKHGSEFSRVEIV